MRRVATGSQLGTLPTPNAASGTPGYFNNAAPGIGVTPTVPGPDWFNIVQEELMSVLAAASVSPDNTGVQVNQLLTAITTLIGRRQRGMAGPSGTGAWAFTGPAGVYVVKFRAWGGGGGGGGGSSTQGAGGGGGATYVEGLLPVTPGNVYNHTVGAAGTAGTGGSSPTGGGAGGMTIVLGDSVTIGVPGGSGGGAGGAGTGGTGGGVPTGISGLSNLLYFAGMNGQYGQVSTEYGGAGGSAFASCASPGGFEPPASVFPGAGGAGGFVSANGLIGVYGGIILEW